MHGFHVKDQRHTPTSIVSATVINANFAAAGKRLRNLPFDTDWLKSSS
jgi:isoquinoline 1-oxidoreductase beta subunit